MTEYRLKYVLGSNTHTFGEEHAEEDQHRRRSVETELADDLEETRARRPTALAGLHQMNHGTHEADPAEDDRQDEDLHSVVVVPERGLGGGWYILKRVFTLYVSRVSSVLRWRSVCMYVHMYTHTSPHKKLHTSHYLRHK